MAINFHVTAEDRGFLSTMDSVRKSVHTTMRDVEQSGKGIEDVFENIKRTASRTFLGLSAAGFINKVKQVRGEFQQLEIAFKTMLGSEQAAMKLMDQLVKTAATTPFDLKGVADGAKMLLAYGIEVDKVNEMLVRLGDVAAGMSIPLGDLVYLYGTTMVQGRMFTQDLRQFQGRGIPIAEELAKVLHVTTNEIGDLVTAGKVTADVFHQAFINMTNDGSKFGGLMEEQSKTILGQISNIEDGIDMMFNDIGKQSDGVINTSLSGVSYLVENWRTVGEAIGVVAVSIGSYKAVMVAVNAVHKANNALMAESAVQSALAAAAGHTLTAAQAKQAATEVLLTNARRSLIVATKELAAATLANPYVWAAAAITTMVVMTYKLVTAENAETIARRNANSEMQEFANKLDDQKNKIQGYIQTLQDANATEYEKAVAWEMLNKTAPTLTAKYDKAALATVELSKVTKELTEHNEELDYENLKKGVEKYTKELNRAKAAEKAYLESKTPDPNGVRARAVGERVAVAQANLDAYAERLAEMNRIRQQMIEDAKPIEIRIQEANDNVHAKEEIYKFYRQAIDLAGELREAHDSAEGTIANTSIPMDYQNIAASVRGRFDQLIGELETDVDNLRTKISESPASVQLDKELKNKEKVLEDLLNMKKEWDWSGATTIPVFLEMHYRDAKNAYDDSKGGGREGMRFDGPTGKWVKDETKKPTKTAAQWKADAYTDWKKAEKALDDYYKQKDQIDKETFDKKVEELQSDVDEAKKAYQKYGGSTAKGGKGTSDASKRRAQELQEQWNYENEMNEIKRNAEDARTQAAVAAIVNDSEREREERKTQHEQTIRDIELQEDDIYKTIYERRKRLWELTHKDSPYETTAEGSKGYGYTVDENTGKKTYVMSGTLNIDEKKLYDQRYAIIKASLDKENVEYARYTIDRQKAELQAMRDFLKEYGTFEEKKLAITRDYEQRIADEQDPSKKASLMMQRDRDLENLSSEQIKQQINWDDIFTDLRGHTTDYLEGLREQLQGLISSGTLKLDELEVAQGKIRDINALISEQSGFFSTLGPMQIEYNRRLQEEADAKDRLKQAQNVESSLSAQYAMNKASLQDFLTNNGQTAKDVSIDMKNPFKEGSTEWKQFNDMIAKLRYSEGQLAKARENTVKATQNAKKAEDGTKTTAKDRWEKFLDSKAVQTSMANLSSAPELLKNIGLGDAGEKAKKGLDGMNDAMGAVTDYMSGNYIGALSKGVSAITNFGEAFGLWSNSNRAEVEAANEKLQIATDVNTEAINRLTDAMKSQSPMEAVKSWEQAQKMMELNERNRQQTMANNAGMYDGGHSLWYDFNDEYGDRFIRELYRLVGKQSWDGSYDIGSAVHDFSGEDWNKLLREFPEKMTKLGQMIADVEDDGNYNGMFQDILDLAKEYSKEAYEELKNTLNESITGVSFDSFKDKFKSSLMDMKKDAASFSDDFTEMLMQSVLDAKIEDLFGDEMSDLYDQWVNALSDNSLTDNEVKRLQDQQDDLVKRMMAERDMLAAMTGYGSSHGSDKSATYAYADKVTYDQMDEFTGILTAVQIAVEHGGDVREQILATLQTMAGMTSPDNQDVREIRNLLMTTNDYLLDIKKSNREILNNMVEQFEVAINAIKEI